MFSRRNVLQGLSKTTSTHVGLWLDKYLIAQTEEGNDATTQRAPTRQQTRRGPAGQRAGNDDESSADGKGKKQQLIQDVESHGIPDDYRIAYARRKNDLDRFLCADATALGRMVIGLGAKGALEAGLRLEHTWGVPIIPGSALKGLAAAAAHQLLEDGAWRKRSNGAKRDKTSFDELFGTTDDSGKVTFHDAWWIPGADDKTLPIHLDVMTVHHPEYYQHVGTGNPPAPSDMDSPIPIPFASVSGKYLVALEGDREWCEAAMDILKIGLTELGIGAKTNAGYGRMRLSWESVEEKAEQARQEEAKRIADAAKRAEEERAARLDALRAQFARYEPGRKDAAVRALVGAIDVGIERAQVVDALSKVDKRHRAVLVETARAALNESGRVLLDAVVTELAAPVVVRVEQQPVVLEKPREPAGPQSVRVRYEPDEKAPKRFFLHIEGESKRIKSAVVDIDDELLAKLRVTGEWVEVVMVREGAKVKVRKGGRG